MLPSSIDLARLPIAGKEEQVSMLSISQTSLKRNDESTSKMITVPMLNLSKVKLANHHSSASSETGKKVLNNPSYKRDAANLMMNRLSKVFR